MFRRFLIGSIAIAVVTIASIRRLRQPSNHRAWVPQQRVMPRIAVRGDRVEIRGIRDFLHRSDTDFDRRYFDRTYDLRKLDSVWYVVSRFGGVPGLAHAFLSFGFDGDYVCVSVEARKEANESYSPLRGLLNQYELMYVIGSERDIIGVRTHVWKESVTLYPVTASPEAMRRAFADMVTRAAKLERSPEFYDTLLNSCNSNIVAHVNTIAPGRIGFDVRTILPGFADRVAAEKGLIDISRRIDVTSSNAALDEKFSAAIRAGVRH